MPAGIGAVTVWPSGVSQRSRRRRITCGRSTRSWTRKSSQPLKREPAGTSAAMTRSSWMVRRPILGAFTPRPRPVSAGSGPVPFSMPLGLTLGRPFTPLSVATSARSSAIACRSAAFSASNRSARASSSPRDRPERGIFADADMPRTSRPQGTQVQPRKPTAARGFAPRTSDCFYPADFSSRIAADRQPRPRPNGKSGLKYFCFPIYGRKHGLASTWRRGKRVSRPDYNADLDYLIAVSSYLAFSEKWSGTPLELSTYLALDRDKIKYVFDVYRSIFRKSLR